MIFDHVTNLKQYAGIPGVEEVLRFLAENPADTLLPGRYDLPGGLWCTVSEPTLREDGPFEVHRRYIDVQLILEGSERIDWLPLGLHRESVPFSEEQDIGFFDDASEEALALRLFPGQLTVFFPEDAHKSLLRLRHDHVKKAVFKIPVVQNHPA